MEASVSKAGPALSSNALPVAILAALAIIGASVPDLIWLHYLCKPLTTLMIFRMVWNSVPAVSLRYRRAVLIGVVFSLVGDLFLMLPAGVFALGFILGLASFLVAHLWFLRALTTDSRLFARPAVFAGIGLVGAANLLILWPGLSADLRIPVATYVACLLTMTSQAVARHLSLQTPASRMAAIGVAFFMLSDPLLAYDRFHAPLPQAALLILATYYLALWHIGRSVLAKPLTS